MEPLLELTDLHVYQGQRHVIRGLTTTIGYGELVGILGQNGSGKSTLLSTITGRVQPRSGSMRLAGEPYRPESPEAAKSAGVSVIAQDFRIPAGLSVAQAMFRGSFIADAADDVLHERAREQLAVAGLDLDVTKDVAELNAAELALVEVMRVSAEEAQLVVLDEVSVVLNDAEVAQLHATIRRLRDEGRSILYVAHRLEEVRAVASRILILRGGQIVDDVASREVKIDDLAFKMLEREAPIRQRQDALDDPTKHITVDALTVEDTVFDVSLDLHMGEAFGIVGLRTSGAHELAQALGGVIDCSVDAIHIGETEYASIGDAGDRIAYLGGFREADEQQRISALLTRDADSESELLRMREAAQRAHELDLSTSNIHDEATSLSVGDRQKVAVATLVDTSADLVVLDHPSRGVDIGAIERVHEVIRGLLMAGKTAILISNDLGEVLRVSHRIGVMHEGRLVAVLHNEQTDEDEIMSYVEGGTAEFRFGRSSGRRARRE